MIFYLVWILSLMLMECSSQDIERMIVPQGQAFRFDCHSDESAYFARRLNEWTELEENNENYRYLNIKFTVLTNEKILRVTIDSAEAKHVGYYACRKASWTSTAMSSIYQLILADVQSFYWNYICHGPIGSCQRMNDPINEDSSRFEVADRTNIELFCCATVTGYKTVQINMNSIGDNRDDVEVNKKQESDGSWVICANQRTIIQRKGYNQQRTLTCELILDNRQYSTLSSSIIIKDALVRNIPETYPAYFDRDQDNAYFNRYLPLSFRSRRRLSTGKKIAIIIGSVVAGVLLLGLIACLILFLCRNKKASSSNSKPMPKKTPKYYLPVHGDDKSRYQNQDTEPVYEEPTPLPSNAPVFTRC